MTPPLEVAIVGGGIIGVMTAMGLLRRDIRVTIYERATEWHEISAGFGFTGVARECMRRIDPVLIEILTAISQKASSNANTRYWDGFHPRTKQDAQDDAAALLFQMPSHQLDFWGAVRSHLQLAMAAKLPEGVVKNQKQLVNYNYSDSGSGVELLFADGSKEHADVLIGCDGVHSTTRKLMLGDQDPASRPSFSHTVAYRTMRPISEGIEALGEDKAMSACMHCGPGVNMMSYPVMNGTLLNIAIFAHGPSDFPDPERMTAPATREELTGVVAGMSPQLREIAQLFPEKMVKWGIYDMYNHPAPTYAAGLVCVAGDAAHASSPHQGAGACMGVEDALVLCEVLDAAQAQLSSDKAGNRAILERALLAYSQTNIKRSQWLVRSSREMGDMYQWRYGPTGRDPQRCRAKLDQASRTIWDHDVENMVAEARKKVLLGNSAVE